MRLTRLPMAALAAALCAAGSAPADTNLIRNGSFEGTLHYWLDTTGVDIAQGQTPSGQHFLNLNGKRIRSTPIPVKTGESVRIGFWARAQAPGQKAYVGLHPAQREIAQRVGGWGNVFEKALGTEWEWVETERTVRGDVWPAWWLGNSYILRLQGDAGVSVDGVSVWHGESRSGAPARVPVEAVSRIENAPGYHPNGGLHERGETITGIASLFNASSEPQSVTLRVELMNYEGTRRWGDVRLEQTLTFPAGESIVQRVPMALGDAVGLMLARVSVLDREGNLIDKSDAPVTVLAFPKTADQPDPRERFGASMRGSHVSELGRRIGFRWTRWSIRFPDHKPDRFNWPDATVQTLARQGHGSHIVIWGSIHWGENERALPEDMNWPAGDPRWDDLSLNTSYDRYVRELVTRYKDRDEIVWELSNEPDLVWRNDPALAAKIQIRTARLVRQVKPDAYIMYNCTWPTITDHGIQFFQGGGAQLIDAYSYHNYNPVEAATHQAITNIRGSLRSYAGDRNIDIWFNEGWCHINSSRDDAQPVAVGQLAAPQAAHAAIRYTANVLAAGQDKIVLFHIGYPQHGRSFWDAVGSGTELWEEDGTPTIMVAGWNTAADCLGLSRFVRSVRPKGAVLHVFDDLRNKRGAVVAFATRNQDVPLQLPLTDVISRDVVGADTSITPQTGKTPLTLRADGQPVYLFTSTGLSAAQLAEALLPLDEVEAAAAAGVTLYSLPSPWTGTQAGTAENNPPRGDGVMPNWALYQVWPDNPSDGNNYIPMTWSGRNWHGEQQNHGGQPNATAGVDSVVLSTRGAWPDRPGKKVPALTFIAPSASRYSITGNIDTRRWDGAGKAALHVLIRRAGRAETRELARIPLQPDMKDVALPGLAAFVRPPEEIVFAVVADDQTAWNVTLHGLRVIEQPPGIVP